MLLCLTSVTKSKMIIKHYSLLVLLVWVFSALAGAPYAVLDISEVGNDHGTFTHAWCSLTWWWRHYLSILVLCGWLLHLTILIMICGISATKSKMIIIEHWHLPRLLHFLVLAVAKFPHVAVFDISDKVKNDH